MFEHDLKKEKAYRFSRFDSNHLLSSISAHPIELEGETWKTAEHYVWSHVVKKEKHREQIKNAESGQDAFKLGNKWYRSKIDNWKNLRRILMTRALYTKVQMYSDVKEEILNTNDQLILETSLYDHYWGVGRDQRGENMMGVIWMDIRDKLREK